MICVSIFIKNKYHCGVIVQGIFRSNFILFGVPIATSLYGQEQAGTIAILLAFVIPLFNLLSIIALQVFSNQKTNVQSLFIDILKNPLIVASIIAFFFIFTMIKLPTLIESTMLDIAHVATPLALIALGGSFQFRGIGKYKKYLCIAILSKLVIVPVIFIPLSIFFGFRGMELTALMAMFASPTAVSTFTMAQSVKANDELAGQIVVMSSILSIITIFAWITILKHANLI